jgi:predicted DNA-binding transcriptional regulator AlpA
MQPELLDIHAVCAMLGGTRPRNPSSVYRYVAKGIWPKPIRIGGTARWIRAECEAALAKMMAGRGR